MHTHQHTFSLSLLLCLLPPQLDVEKRSPGGTLHGDGVAPILSPVFIQAINRVVPEIASGAPRSASLAALVRILAGSGAGRDGPGAAAACAALESPEERRRKVANMAWRVLNHVVQKEVAGGQVRLHRSAVV